MPQTAPTVPDELRHALRGLLLDELVNVQAELATLHDALVILERDGRYELRHDDLDSLVHHRVGDLADSANGVPEETCEWGSLDEFERLAELLGHAIVTIEVESEDDES